MISRRNLATNDERKRVLRNKYEWMNHEQETRTLCHHNCFDKYSALLSIITLDNGLPVKQIVHMTSCNGICYGCFVFLPVQDPNGSV